MTADPTLAELDRLVGTWATEATHPALPGVVVHGTAVGAWLAGGRFLTLRACTDHPDFPDSLSVIGDMGHDRVDGAGAPAGAGPAARTSALRMHYFDARGVFRLYEVRVDDASWQWWRDAAGFSQRFTGRSADGGETIVGRSQLCTDHVHWADDLAITYRRQHAP